jgi:mono/diheme cytochrome c family protein
MTQSATSRRFLITPFTGALVAAFAFGVVACGGDDDDDVAARSAEGGTSGSGGKGGTSGKGGSGGTSGKGGTAGTAPTGGKATVIPPGEYDGQEVFRFDTFGDEQFWTGTLRMHEAIQAALTPVMALELGLKVDAEVLPEGILEEVDLEDPATTVALIGMNAVVGVQGTVDGDGNLTSVGITCALCHSDVDDSIMPGIGVRIDGAANRDLDPGAIIALAPGLEGMDEALDVYRSWGPGYYDPRFNQDGINHPVVIPPIYGLADVPLETYTGDGPISYWNAYVGITQMGGIGNFFDPRIGVSIAYDQDMINPKLPALFEYQVSLEPAAPPDDAFDPDAAARGQELFVGAANCNSCHSGARLTDAATTLHAPDETGMDPTYAERTATKMYRTTPLRALLAHPPYFHDGSAATLADVVTHYDAQFELGLSAEQQADLVEYLNSL